MPNRGETVASQVLGAVKAVKATVKNFSGVFKQLTREHGEVTALILKVKGSSDVAVRRDLFPTIREELLAHEKGELAEVYPVYRQHGELASYAEMHEADAGALERMLDHVGGLAYEAAEWEHSFARLAQMVARHAKEEEDEFFPVANRILGKEVAEEMLVRYLARKAAPKG